MSGHQTQVIEVINRNTVVNIALGFGYNAYLPVYDGGVDFVLYNEKINRLFKVQMKGRWMVAKKYLGRDISMVFPDRGTWYLVPHDKMVEWAEERGFTSRDSWNRGGATNTPRLTKHLLDLCAPFELQKVLKQGCSSTT